MAEPVEVTEANWDDTVLNSGRAGARGLLGRMVRPLQDDCSYRP